MGISDLRKVIRRGDVWVCDLTAENGENCQTGLLKKRFCLVISSDEWNSIEKAYPLVLPFSTVEAANGAKTVSCLLGGTKPTSYIRTASIQSVSLCNFIHHKGSLTAEKMDEIDAHLSNVFGLDIKKYIDRISELEAELLKAREAEKSLLCNLNKNINTEASELVLENERLKEEVAKLNNTLKYRDKQLTMFRIPVKDDDSQPIEISNTMKTVNEPATESPKEVKKKRYNRGRLNTRIVINDWSARKCMNFIKFAEANTITSTMDKYGIISNGTYQNVLNVCRSKALAIKK